MVTRTLSTLLAVLLMVFMTSGCEVNMTGGGGNDGAQTGDNNNGDNNNGDNNEGTGGITRCQACAILYCSDELEDCEDSTTCNAIMVCVDKCKTGSLEDCMDDCIEANPRGEALFTALSDCVVPACPVCTTEEGNEPVDQGPGDDGNGNENGNGGGDRNDDDGCEGCISLHCGPEETACNDSDDCTAAMECVEECWDTGPAACIQDCMETHPDGSGLYLELLLCVTIECPEDCFEPEDYYYTRPFDDDCLECIDEDCSGQFDVCEDSDDCFTIMECVYECTKDLEDCIEACRAATPGGQALFDPLLNCVEQQCAECLEVSNIYQGYEGDDCEECMNVSCGHQQATCMRSTACMDITICLNDCTDDDFDQCLERCATENPEGLAVFTGLYSCVLTKCGLCFEFEEDDPDTDTEELKDPIGVPYDGGTIYLYPEDMNQGELYPWGPQDEGDFFEADSETDGAANTATILASLENNEQPYPANICSELDAFGHQDWYLPSKDEMQALYDHPESRETMEMWYWSSTEISQGKAWAFNADDNVWQENDKYLISRIRCIRR